MTDLELNAVTAQAMGWTVGRPALSVVGYHVEECALITSNDQGGEHVWDPLHNDAQAFALIERHEALCIQHTNDRYAEWTVRDYTLGIFTRDRSLRRAIVECVAKMQESRREVA